MIGALMVCGVAGGPYLGIWTAKQIVGICRKKRTEEQANRELIDAYYQRVVHLGRPDPRFLISLYRGCMLLTGLDARDLLDSELLKALVYSRIISASYLPHELRKAIITTASLEKVVLFSPSKKEIRQMARSMSPASRRFVRSLPYEAAAMAVMLYCAMTSAADGGMVIAEAAEFADTSQIYAAVQPVREEKNTLDAEMLYAQVAMQTAGKAHVVQAEHVGEQAAMPQPDDGPKDRSELMAETAKAEQSPAETKEQEEAVTAVTAAIHTKMGSSAGAAAESVASAEKNVDAVFGAADDTEESAVQAYYDIALSHELQDYTRQICAEYDFPPEYAFAMMFKESGFRAGVVSGSNDYGIMQINKCNHARLKEQFGVTNFLDAKQNIRCGVYMIAYKYHAYGDIHLALMAYNMGDNGASKHWKKGTYTSAYSRVVVGYAETLISTGRLP